MRNPEEIIIPKPKVGEEEESKDYSCQYCQDVGACKFCEGGKIKEQALIKANEGKPLKKGKFYAKRNWNWHPKEKNKKGGK